MDDESALPIGISFSLLIFIAIVVVFIIIKIRASTSPSPRPDTGNSSTHFIKWNLSSTTIPPDSPVNTISDADLSPSDEAAAIIASLAEAMAIGTATTFTLGVVGSLADAISSILFGNETFIKALKSFPLRYPAIKSLLTLNLSYFTPGVVEFLRDLQKKGISISSSEVSQRVKQAPAAIQEALSSTLRDMFRFEASSAAYRVVSASLAGRVAEAADVARAFGTHGAVGLAGSIANGVDVALVALNIIDMSLTAANVGGYAEGLNAGDFLEQKNQKDYESDKSWFDSVQQYPAYIGPLEDVYKLIDAANSSPPGALSADQQTMLDNFNTDIQVQISAYISSSLAAYLNNKFSTNSENVKYVSATLTYVFDTILFGSDAILSECATPEAQVDSLAQPPVIVNSFYDSGTPLAAHDSGLPASTPTPTYIPALNNPLILSGGLSAITPEVLRKVHSNVAKVVDNITNCDYLNLYITAVNNLCIAKGGYVAEGQYCSYTKDDCLAKQKWPVEPGAVYKEWRSNGTSGNTDIDATGNLDGEQDWYGASYPWKAYIDGKFVYSPGGDTAVPGIKYKDNTAPPYFDQKNGFYTVPQQYFDKGIRVRGKGDAMNPEGFCLVRQYAIRQDCEKEVATATGTGRNVYDSLTGICQNTRTVCNARGLDFGSEPISKLGGNHGVKFPKNFAGKLNTCTKSDGQKFGELLIGGTTVVSFFNSLVLQGSSSGSGAGSKPSNFPVQAMAGSIFYLQGSAAVVNALKNAVNTLSYQTIAIGGTNQVIDRPPPNNTDPENFVSQLTNIEISGLSGSSTVIG